MSDTNTLDRPFVLPATQKQILFARNLAMRNNVLLPWEVQNDRFAISKWIEQQALKDNARSNHEPSSKQVAFAERLARIKRRNVPDECFKSRDLMSRWITSNK